MSFLKWTASCIRPLLKFALTLCLFFVGCTSSPPMYKIGVDPRWSNINAEGKEGRIYAFSKELMEHIAQQENIAFTLVSVSWENLLYKLQHHQVDAVLAFMEPRLFLEKEYTFADSFLSTGQVIVTAQNATISTTKDLQGKEIAVVNGDDQDASIVEVVPGVLIRYYDSLPEALNAVFRGTIDGALVDILVAQGYVHDLYQDKLKIAIPPLNEEGLRLIALYGQQMHLIHSVNKGIHALKDSGVYQKLADKWQVGYTQTNRP